MEVGGHVTISLACIFQARNDLNLVVVLGFCWEVKRDATEREKTWLQLTKQ